MIRHPAAPQDTWGPSPRDPITAAAGVSGGASLLGGLLNSSSSSKAASIEAKQASASAAALGQAGEAAQNYLNPYVAGGTSSYQNLLSNPSYGSTSTNYLDNAYGSFTQGSNTTNDGLDALSREGSLLNNLSNGGMSEAQLKATPGYQFTLGQGLQSTQNSAAARGLGVSGAALKGAATYATGLADSTYQQQYNNALSTAQGYGTLANQYFAGAQNEEGVGQGYLGVNSGYQGNLTNTFNRQNALAGYGANASGASASNALTAAGASNSAALSGASALAGGITGSTGALTGGLSNAANAYAGSQYLQYQNLLSGGGGMYGVNPAAAARMPSQFGQ